MKIRLIVLVIASLLSLATSKSKSETPVRPVVSMAIVNGKDSDMAMGEKNNTSQDFDV